MRKNRIKRKEKNQREETKVEKLIDQTEDISIRRILNILLEEEMRMID